MFLFSVFILCGGKQLQNYITVEFKIALLIVQNTTRKYGILVLTVSYLTPQYYIQITETMIFVFIAVLIVAEVGAMNGTWHKFGQEEYFISTSTVVGINSASAECQKLNGSLAIVKNNETQLFLVQSIGQVTEFPYAFYIGLRRFKNSSDGFMWDDGTLISSGVTYWYRGEPNYYKDQNESCVSMGYQNNMISPYFNWNDYNCGLAMRIICQRCSARHALPIHTYACNTAVGGGRMKSSVIYIIIGCVVACIFVVFLVFCFCWKMRKRINETPELSMNIYETPIRREVVPEVVYHVVGENLSRPNVYDDAGYAQLRMYRDSSISMRLFVLVALFVVGWSNALNGTWYKLGQEEYFISTSTVVGINSASAECQKLNGSLVIIKNNETQEFLVGKIGYVSRYPFAFYIGLRRFKNTSDGFIWDDGALVTSRPTHWYPGEPNNYMGMNQSCVTMGLESNPAPFLWFDVSCDLLMRVICQRSLVRRTRPVVTTASITSSSTHNTEK
ncbi:uncharacterized protein LOC101243125 [Ciona intestinalis]